MNNVIKLAKVSLNKIFQDSFDKILSQKLIHDRSYISQNSESEKKKIMRNDDENCLSKIKICIVAKFLISRLVI